MIVYRVRYQTRHDTGGWLSMVVYRQTKKLAEAFRAEVVEENWRLVTDGDPLAPDNALSPTVEKIDIRNKQQLLNELTLAACAGQP